MSLHCTASGFLIDVFMLAPLVGISLTLVCSVYDTFRKDLILGWKLIGWFIMALWAMCSIFYLSVVIS